MYWWHWIVIGLLLLWIIHNPTQASADVHNVFTFFGDLTR